MGPQPEKREFPGKGKNLLFSHSPVDRRPGWGKFDAIREVLKRFGYRTNVHGSGFLVQGDRCSHCGKRPVFRMTPTDTIRAVIAALDALWVEHEHDARIDASRLTPLGAPAARQLEALDWTPPAPPVHVPKWGRQRRKAEARSRALAQESWQPSTP